MSIKFKKRWIKPAAIWLIYMAALGFVHFVFVVPVGITVSKQRQAVSDKTSETAIVLNYVSEKNLKDLQKQIDMRLDRMSRYVTEVDKANECSYAVGNIAEMVGVSDFSTKQNANKAFSKIENCELLLVTKINISCEGSSGKFFKLVNEYERHSPVVLIDEFSVKLADDGLDEIKMSLSVLVDNRGRKLVQD